MQAPGPPCQATTRAGAPCKGTAGPSGFCTFHDPARAEAQRSARRRGGESSRKKLAVLPEEAADLPLASVRDVTAALGTITNLVLKGKLDVKVSNAAAYLLATLVRALEVGDLEERLAVLEGQAQAKAALNGRY